MQTGSGNDPGTGLNSGLQLGSLDSNTELKLKVAPNELKVPVVQTGRQPAAPAVLPPTGESINAKDYVAKGTGSALFLGWTVLILGGPLVIIGLALATYGIFLVAWIILALAQMFQHRKARALLRGSSVVVGPDQFSQIHTAVEQMAGRLGLTERPDVFVVEDNHQNAFALKHGKKKSIILVDDVVFGALSTGNEKALNFIIAHELAHHALGHTNYFRRIISSKNPKLSRMDEFSCDAVALALVGDMKAAQDALVMLLIGPQLYPKVNRAALEAQAEDVVKDKLSRKSELRLTHPLLLRRYARLKDPTIKA